MNLMLFDSDMRFDRDLFWTRDLARVVSIKMFIMGILVFILQYYITSSHPKIDTAHMKITSHNKIIVKDLPAITYQKT